MAQCTNRRFGLRCEQARRHEGDHTGKDAGGMVAWDNQAGNYEDEGKKEERKQMIKITSHANTAANRQPNKIEEIKAVRAWTKERYGVSAGLKESKEFVEHLQTRQGEDPIFDILQRLGTLGYEDLSRVQEAIKEELSRPPGKF